MQPSAYQSLGPPPRELPRRVILMTIFGDVQTWLGIIFMGIGIFVSAFFFPFADFSMYKFWTQPLQMTEAIVTKSQSANMTYNDQPVYNIYYEYEDAQGNKQEGKGLSVTTYEPQEIVEVEYIQDESAISRLEEGGGIQLIFFLFLMPMMFPLIGLILVLVKIPQMRKRIYLLRQGYLAYGTLKSKTATNTRINNAPVMKFEYEFNTHDGLPYTMIAKTHRQDRMPETEAGILYASEDPNNAIALAALPFDISINDAQQMTASAARGLISIFLVLGVAIAMLIAGVLVFVIIQNPS